MYISADKINQTYDAPIPSIEQITKGFCEQDTQIPDTFERTVNGILTMTHTPPRKADAVKPALDGSDNHLKPDAADSNCKSREARPKFSGRKSSGTMIIPRDFKKDDTPQDEYPPDDARAMSPRRNSVDTEKLSNATRLAARA